MFQLLAAHSAEVKSPFSNSAETEQAQEHAEEGAQHALWSYTSFKILFLKLFLSGLGPTLMLTFHLLEKNGIEWFGM